MHTGKNIMGLSNCYRRVHYYRWMRLGNYNILHALNIKALTISANRYAHVNLVNYTLFMIKYILYHIKS